MTEPIDVFDGVCFIGWLWDSTMAAVPAANARPFRPYGTPPPFDMDDYKDSFEIWHAQWDIFLELSTINADAIDATVASVAVGFAYGTQGSSLAISAAGAGATNSIGTTSSAQIAARSSGAGELKAGSINLTTLDIGQIQSGVGAGIVAISYAPSGFSVAPAIGAATSSR